jgi:hypothetical protein
VPDRFSGRNVPSGVIVDIGNYKNIQSRLTEIKAIQQLLRKYHRLARRPSSDKGILELGFIAKTTFSKFENNLKVIIEKQGQKKTSSQSWRGKNSSLVSPGRLDHALRNMQFSRN